MGNAEWIALAGLVLSLGTVIFMTGRGQGQIKASMGRELNTIELAFERKVGQMEVGLRAKINDVEFHLRDNYVSNAVFVRLIDMATANNENQFRALSEQLSRLNDKLDAIQAEQRRQP